MYTCSEHLQLVWFWSWHRWYWIGKYWRWKLNPHQPPYTNSILWNASNHTLCKSVCSIQYAYRAIHNDVFNPFIGEHKWNSFISIPIYWIPSTNVSIAKFNETTDCSFLGWCEHWKIWKHFIQDDIQCHPSPKSPWSTAGVVSILWRLHSNYTVYCHMGQSGTA